jgi:glyoxylase-like metal-dependent hydrolase (beta-lactamase superfamily II)
MCPVARGLLNESGTFVCHVLLIETGDGLVLVDSGMGLDDVANPRRRLGPVVHLMRPVADPDETAARRVEQLGFRRSDVRHIVLTHLDLDHGGGLSDFPDARVHVHDREHEAAIRSPGPRDRIRYRPIQFAHGPRFERYEPSEGDGWFGFSAVRDLRGLPPEILLVPLLGHSRGHSGVAVDTGDGWLLHCGDAYFYHAELDEPPRCPVGFRIFQSSVEHDRGARLENQARLRALKRAHAHEVRPFSAHDPSELDRLTARAERR